MNLQKKKNIEEDTQEGISVQKSDGIWISKELNEYIL